ncbi:PTS sugar transporter subunit IIA [Tissierella creatinophila]|uniref:Glucose-specific phosphotransferase enzyme IIA component n=1 Tax=Tissierella creatinophila DSM 6911 TaxID=1123403 RepID=A0A1U7M660_TISCR|nr:PTS glucose transporter subunit IIA [Tissierella creatinophila]OLS02787.1 glucose-specific phosphotransferase enzyme IIA component [Tissierella creatinophila DSM 6911]
MFKNFFKKDNKPLKDRNVELFNPVDGEVVSLEKVPDEVFSQKMLGDGFAIMPTGEKIYSPIGGEIKVLFPTLHAISIESKEGLEILIHIGIDTVELDGKGFESNIKLGDQVKAGDLLVSFDKNIIEDSGKDTITPIVITNMDQVKELNIEYGIKKANEKIADVKLN